MEEKIEGIVEVLEELMDDNTVPRNVKNKISEAVSALKEKAELSLRTNKALNILDDISDDNNIQAYTRTQIWNIVSTLESLN